MPNLKSLLQELQENPRRSSVWRELDPEIRQIVRGCLGGQLQPADADDLAQTILEKVLDALKKKSLYNFSGFCAWVMRVTRNSLADFQATAMRVRKRGLAGTGGSAHQELIETLANEKRIGNALVYSLLLREIRKVIRRLVATKRLDAKQAKTWELRRLRGKKPVDIAKQLGKTENSVNTTISRVQDVIFAELDTLTYDQLVDAIVEPYCE